MCCAQIEHQRKTFLYQFQTLEQMIGHFREQKIKLRGIFRRTIAPVAQQSPVKNIRRGRGFEHQIRALGGVLSTVGVGAGVGSGFLPPNNVFATELMLRPTFSMLETSCSAAFALPMGPRW